MNDAATVWVAAFWLNLGHPGTTSVPGALVWVLNPGALKAQVTVRFFKATNGDLINQATETVDPKTTSIFGAGDNPETPGWCRINSDQPVVPWGLTQFRSGDDSGYLNMTFYRFEGPQINIPIPKIFRRP